MRFQASKNSIIGLAGILLIFLPLALHAQNRILVISEYETQIGDYARLDSIAAALNYRVVYDTSIPFDLDVSQYSLLVIGGIAGDNCTILQDYLSHGGGILLTGPAPDLLFRECEETADVARWLGFDYYMNGSGNMAASIDLDQISIARDSLLDRTACGMSFGGLLYPKGGAEVLVNWICPTDGWTVAAVTRNHFENGKIYYFSRPLSAVRSRQLFGWALEDAIEYRWGDVDNSNRVNLSDVVYIIRYVFQAGSAPVNLNAGDPNADGKVNVSDAIYLISYIFSGGNPPMAGQVN